MYSIANANNTTIDELVNLNELVGTNIYTGQVLQIPNSGGGSIISPTTNQTYIVEKGDTLYSVALKYNTTPSNIINQNGLTSDKLSVGQTLIIPPDIESTGEEITNNSNTYIVKKGDSLYSIANLYNVPVQDLINYNNLSGEVITVGQVLNIPTNNGANSNSNIYVVQKGDNLWSISKKYGVTVNSIRMINNLTNDVLTIGQTLIIP